ncbi:hypothetical protein G9A89_015799 [Geosiphon pyriformis]|nr:hypothetical protein G9A89_015799 [Geosiphon pyriformis]
MCSRILRLPLCVAIEIVTSDLPGADVTILYFYKVLVSNLMLNACKAQGCYGCLCVLPLSPRMLWLPLCVAIDVVTSDLPGADVTILYFYKVLVSNLMLNACKAQGCYGCLCVLLLT